MDELNSKVITINTISNILDEKSREGKAQKIKNLLNKYNAGKLIELEEKYYFDFVQEAKKL
ncbi:hypothetical protein [Clostridium celatum]|uniref:hypothetical protein n=1 Tax=Clostridium celatum TaxID=36834 RepID=UPI0028FF2408|nr:hypothetical protein [Clostridium celatum]MDU2265227.1 hypothetical protein [Clostridium celatum]MDU6295953.1 hypothetical protein [Clostridium celatum]